jgi:hypothetical protein
VAAGTVRPAAAIAIIMFRIVLLLFVVAVSLHWSGLINLNGCAMANVVKRAISS